MVRLIDLDKIDVFNQTSEQVVFDIIHAEPVEAIPVGWLESQIDIYIDLGLNTIAKELRVLIDDWRKENETNKRTN